MWTAHRYHDLADRLYAEVAPVPVRAPTLVALDETLAADLGLEPAWLRSPEGVAALAGNAVLPGTRPVALAYAGHQFGQFVPSLGDGRAVLLGEVVATDGRRREIQLKGSGRTPFSRGGDGRAALGPMLREFVISAAMAGLGIPTTRSLAVIATGEPVRRETMLPGAIVVRVAESHVRVGTFQYFAARGDREALALLVDDVVARSYPELAATAGPERAAALLDAACARQAKLVASWMGVGFVHGVMNTDNVALAGETIDYGPCAFLDAYDPATVFSSIDRIGRYAFANQPHMAGWAMARLAEALLPLLADDRDRAVAIAQAAIDRMAAASTRAYDAVMAAKIGLAADDPAARDLVTRLLAAMAATAADHTATFTALTDATADPAAVPALAARLSSSELAAWLEDHRAAVAAGTGAAAAAVARMRAANPR
ncbi:protein adenylyltransferase SelO, partial [Oharaeibacter diazotrophicus]